MAKKFAVRKPGTSDLMKSTAAAKVGPKLALGGTPQFTYTGAKNVKVTLINYYLPPPEKLRFFKSDSWETNFEDAIGWLSPLNGQHSHAALLIERLDENGKFKVYRYVSWPGGDNLDDDLRYNYAGSRRVQVELPPLEESDLIRFEQWYRKQPYSGHGETDANDLYDRRLEKKQEIARILYLGMMRQVKRP